MKPNIVSLTLKKKLWVRTHEIYTRETEIPGCLPILSVHLPGQRSVLEVPGNTRGQCAYRRNQRIPPVHLPLLSREFKFSSRIKNKPINSLLGNVNSQLTSTWGPGSCFISKSLSKQAGEWSLKPIPLPQSSTSLERMMKQVFWAIGSGYSTAPWMTVTSTLSTFSAPGEGKTLSSISKRTRRQPKALTSYTVTRQKHLQSW